MSEIKVKLKNFWEKLTPVEKDDIIELIIKAPRKLPYAKIKGLWFGTKNIPLAPRGKISIIELNIYDDESFDKKQKGLKITSTYEFLKDDKEKDIDTILEESKAIIKEMIDREINTIKEDTIEDDLVNDIEMTNLTNRNSEDGHNFETLLDAFNNKGGKTRKRRKKMTKKHLRKKYPNKRMSRKKYV